MTPYQHIWAWAKSLKVDDMDKFIADYTTPNAGFVIITYKNEMKTHNVEDVLEAVRFCREEYRKDQRMTNQKEQ